MWEYSWCIRSRAFRRIEPAKASIPGCAFGRQSSLGNTQWIGKVVLAGVGICGTMMLCCVALVGIVLMAPNRPRSMDGVSTAQAIAVRREIAGTVAAPATSPATATSMPPTNTAIPSPTPEPATATPEPTVAPTDVPTAVPSATPAPTAKPKPTAKPVPKPLVVPATSRLNTNGADHYNCGDFANYAEAYAVYKANLPGDPNRLDKDNDGIPCESLPGAP
jgi:hypothetical protein